MYYFYLSYSKKDLSPLKVFLEALLGVFRAFCSSKNIARTDGSVLQLLSIRPSLRGVLDY